MGDTLPHLPARTDVQQLIAETATALRPGGSFAATYRAQAQELRGTARFIPVRSTPDQILTCFHDLLHTRRDGTWHLKTSSYPKLRLTPQWLTAQCHSAGLEVRHHEPDARGMQVLRAVKH